MTNTSRNHSMFSSKYKIFLLIQTVLGLALYCIAQPPPLTQRADSRSFNQVKKKDGWLTPEIKRLQKIVTTEESFIDGLAVKKNRLEIPKEVDEKIDIYWLDRGDLLLHSVTASVRAVFSYEREKKIFAYSASYVPYTVDENGIRSSIGGVYIFYYYDEDGDGIFETRYSNVTSELPIPKWVRLPK